MHSASALLDAVEGINDRARQRVVDLAIELCGGSLEKTSVAVLGAAFKPLSDDVRDSAALHVAGVLHMRGADVRVYDPEAANNARAVSPALRYVASVDAALAGADLVLHLTEWAQFGELDPAHAASLVRRPRIIGGRNKLDRARWQLAGWDFHGLGRGDRTDKPLDAAPSPALVRDEAEPAVLVAAPHLHT